MRMLIERRKFLTTIGVSGVGLLALERYSSGQGLIQPFFPTPIEEAGIKSSTINDRFAESVVVNEQTMSQWCWAASISMAFGFHGHEVHQETIVEKIKGIRINQPAQGQEITAALSGEWKDAQGKIFRSKCWVYDVQAMTTTKNNNDVIRELKAGRPLVYGSNGHAVLLTFVRYTRDQNGFPWPHYAVVRDPWPGRGRRELSFTELKPIYVAGVQVEESTANEEATAPTEKAFSHIVTLCEKGIQTLKGAPDADATSVGYRSWASTVAFPGADETTIDKHPGEPIELVARFKHDSVKNAKATFEQLVARASEDLGKQWSCDVNKDASKSSGRVFWTAKMKSASSVVKVSIFYTELKNSQTVMVSFVP
jgi:hypothetical protein